MAKKNMSINVQLKLDPKSGADFLKQIKGVTDKASSVDMGLGSDTSKMLKALAKISTARKNLGSSLKDSVQRDIAALENTAKQISRTSAALSDMETTIARKRDAGETVIQEELDAREALAKQLKSQIGGFKREFDQKKKSFKQVKDEVKIGQARLRTQKALAKYGKSDATKDIFGGIRDAIRGDKGGLVKALGGLGKGAGGVAARGTGMAASGLGNVAGMAARFAGPLAAAGAGLGLLIAGIMKASDKQAELNKSLTDGLGISNDLTGDTGRYAKAIDDLRNSAQAASGSLLRMGGTSKTVTDTVNAFAKATTGSIIKTNETMNTFIGGAGQFARSALLYGKALGIEATEAATMMGEWTAEVGYNTSQVQTLLRDVAVTASLSSMPVNKFMDIFKKVTPNVDLFTNRIEDLANTIKYMSRAMSSRDVERFMRAFQGGFEQKSFKQKLATTLIVGKEKSAGMIKGGLEKRIGSMGGASPELVRAFKSGEMGRKEFVSELGKLRADGKMNATEYGNALKMFESYAEASSGDVLQIASSLESADMATTVKLMGAEIGRFTKGGKLVGINEHVAEMRGFSQEQIKAYKQFISTSNSMMTQVETLGTTGSKSMDDVLTKIVARDLAAKKKVSVEQLTSEEIYEAFKKPTQDQIMEANNNNEALKDKMKSAQQIAEEHLTKTTSISEKIDNVIAYLLEKLLRIFDPILSLLDSIYNWMTGKDAQENVKAADALEKSARDSVQWKYAGAATKEENVARAGFIAEAIRDGLTGQSATQLVGSQFDTKQIATKLSQDKSLRSYIYDKAVAQAPGSITTPQNVGRFLDTGDMTAFASLSDDVKKELIRVFVEQGQHFSVGTDVKSKLSTRRPEEMMTPEQRKEYRATFSSTDAVDDSRVKTGHEAGLARVKSLVQGGLSMLGIGPASSSATAPAAAPAAKATSAPGSTGATPAAATSAAKATTTVAKETAVNTDNTSKLVELVQKGIKLDAGWTNGDFKKSMTGAVKDGVQDPLIRHAMLLAKIQTDKSFASTFAGGLEGTGDYSMSALGTAIDSNTLGTYLGLSPGSTPAAASTGGAAGSAAAASPASGNVININVEVATNADPNMIAQMISVKVAEALHK